MMLRFCTTRTVPCGQEHNHKVKHWECIICAHAVAQCLPSAAQSKEDGARYRYQLLCGRTARNLQIHNRTVYTTCSKTRKKKQIQKPQKTYARSRQRHMPETVRQGASFHPSPSVNPILSAVRCACSSVRPLNHPSLNMSSVTELFHTSFAQTD